MKIWNFFEIKKFEFSNPFPKQEYFYLKKNFHYLIEIKKSNGEDCFDMPGECDSSIGLACQLSGSSKICSYIKNSFFFLFLKLFKKFFFLRCGSNQFFDIGDSYPRCSMLLFFLIFGFKIPNENLFQRIQKVLSNELLRYSGWMWVLERS